MPKREVRIGLALGGGGAKGMCHIGVLKVFDKYGIKVSSIAGTSAGAIIGGAYSVGHTPEEIRELIIKYSRKKVLRLSNFQFFHEGLIKSRDAVKMMKGMVGEKTFEETNIPFETVAVNLETGTEVFINTGKLWEAIRASAAIPGLFSPYFIGDKYLVDGGLINNVPVNCLRKHKDLDIIIGVELGSLTSKQYISGMIWEKYYRKPKTFQLAPGFFSKMKLNLNLMVHILLRSIDIATDEGQTMRYNDALPDLIIKPNVGNISLMQFNRLDEAIAQGEMAAEKMIPKLFELIDKHSNTPESST